MLTHEEIYSAVRACLKKYNADYALLFGSYARGEANENSDVDLVIIGGEGFHPTDIFAIADDLYNAWGIAVDVYEMQEIDKDAPLYDAIMREGVKIA